MSGPVRVEFDIAGFRKTVAIVRRINAYGITGMLGGGQGSAAQFISRCQVYITREIDRSLRDNGDIKEGETRTVRGQQWKGWAEWQVKRTRPGYGGTVTEGTRYRQRKFARGSVAAKTGRTWHADERKAMAALPTSERPYEKVWKKRASKQRYSDSSQMMQDTGRMRAGIFLVDTRVVGGVVELRPSQSQVSYFARQNQLRPMWVLELPKDETQVTKYAQEALDDLARIISEAK